MLRRSAATWLVRLQSTRDADIERKFRRWYDSDPRHAAAFDRVRRTYEQAGLLRNSPAAVSRTHEPAIRKSHRTLPPAFAVAAALAVAVPIGALVVRQVGFRSGGTDAVMLMTGVGEIREVDLADGSKVTLDTATKVDVAISRSRRTAHLSYGRARFRIGAGEAFVVETGGMTIATRQGVIDVEQIGPQGRVEVLAGTAEVRGSGHAAAAPLTLGTNESATIGSGGVERDGVMVRNRDWTRGMLQFDHTPLASAVAAANRYSERHIVLVGDLGALSVTGAFRAGDTAGFAKALAEAFGLSLQSSGGNLILSGGGSPVQK